MVLFSTTRLTLKEKEGVLLMAQNDGVSSTRLDNMSIQYGSQVVTLDINPQQYEITWPHRTTVSQTQTTVAVQDFSHGLGTITLSGNTGVKLMSDGTSGKQRMDNLQSILDNYVLASNGGMRPANPLIFYNNTDGYSYTVHIDADGYSIQRDVDNPLWYVYAINFIILKPAGEADPNDRDSTELGNIYPSVTGLNNVQTSEAVSTAGTATTGNSAATSAAAVNPNTSSTTSTSAATAAAQATGAK